MSKKFDLLARSVRGELYTDLIFREVFASSACLYRLLPQAVLIPQNTSDVIEAVKFSRQEKISLTPRGAGSGTAGQAIGKGLILNFTRFFNRILEINPEEKSVWVEPGVIYAQLNQALQPYGLFFPPDPSSGDYCTIGGMLANNSSGAHSLFYGSTQDYILELEVLLSDGSLILAREDGIEILQKNSSLPEQIGKKIPELFQKFQKEIQEDQPRVKNSSGYLIWKAISSGKINFARLFAGSEGTLGIITRARLRLEKIPQAKIAGLFYFKDLESASRAVGELKKFSPLALEIMDSKLLNLVKDFHPDLKAFFEPEARAVLLFEASGEDEAQARQKLIQANEQILGKSRLAYKSILARDEKESDRLWQIRKSASPILYRLGQGLVRFIEDIVIPPEHLPEGIRRLEKIFQEFNTFAPILGHAGEGNLHLNPSLNPRDKNDRKKMQEMAEQVYQMVLELGGSISGEHGDGILRAPFVKRQYPQLYPLFEELKKSFDPEGILNPGKILADEKKLPIENIKYWFPEKASSPLQKELLKNPGLELVFRCHGCGLCRSYCPALEGFESELALPRSKASIVRAFAQGILPEEELNNPHLKTLLESCYSCQRCLALCPTGVEIPRITGGVKNYLRQKAVPSPRELLLERSGELINLISKIPAPFKKLAFSSASRPLLKIIGLNPQASSFPKKQDFSSKRFSPPRYSFSRGEKVIYFPGCLESEMEQELKEKTKILLKELVGDFLMLEDICCGMPALSQGNWQRAKTQAEKFLKQINFSPEQELTIITNCPSCVLMFRTYYPILLGEMGKRFASSVKTIYEWGERFSFKEMKGTYAYHRSCHTIALGEPDPFLRVLEAGVENIPVVELCCGSGGGFELKKENQKASEKISARLKQTLADLKPKKVISACGLCRRKIRQLGFSAISPIEILEVE